MQCQFPSRSALNWLTLSEESYELDSTILKENSASLMFPPLASAMVNGSSPVTTVAKSFGIIPSEKKMIVVFSKHLPLQALVHDF